MLYIQMIIALLCCVILVYLLLLNLVEFDMLIIHCVTTIEYFPFMCQSVYLLEKKSRTVDNPSRTTLCYNKISLAYCQVHVMIIFVCTWHFFYLVTFSIHVRYSLFHGSLFFLNIFSYLLPPFSFTCLSGEKKYSNTCHFRISREH